MTCLYKKTHQAVVIRTNTASVKNSQTEKENKTNHKKDYTHTEYSGIIFSADVYINTLTQSKASVPMADNTDVNIFWCLYNIL